MSAITTIVDVRDAYADPRNTYEKRAKRVTVFDGERCYQTVCGAAYVQANVDALETALFEDRAMCPTCKGHGRVPNYVARRIRE